MPNFLSLQMFRSWWKNSNFLTLLSYLKGFSHICRYQSCKITGESVTNKKGFMFLLCWGLGLDRMIFTVVKSIQHYH